MSFVRRFKVGEETPPPNGGSRGGESAVAKPETPSSNTGLNSQAVSDGLTVKVDWLQCSTVHESLESFQGLLRLLEEAFDDKVDFAVDRPILRGQRWEGSGQSVRGIQVCWNPPDGPNPGRGWFAIGGKVLSTLSTKDVYEFCIAIQLTYDAICRRFDVAMDDYQKQIPPETVIEAAEAGNFARFHQGSWQFIRSGDKGHGQGWSVIFGSAKSDKRLTYYNKTAESCGEIDAYRWEVRLRDGKAHEAFMRFIGIDYPEFSVECPQLLAGIVVGAIDFLDRSVDDPNLIRLPVLSWWADFLQGFEGIRLPAKRVICTINKSVSWFFRSVAPSLAMLKRVFSASEYESFTEMLEQSGDTRLSVRHENAIRVYSADWCRSSVQCQAA